jgi:hypothetical protein
MVLSGPRLRQLADRIRHRLSFVPMLYVIVAIVVVQVLLLIDREVGEQSLPTWFETTVDSARSVFSAMAGGLITSITLLLSMMLVAVRTIVQIRSEVVRRELPGPLEPLDAAASATIATADTSTWSAYERDQFRSIVDVSERS